MSPPSSAPPHGLPAWGPDPGSGSRGLGLMEGPRLLGHQAASALLSLCAAPFSPCGVTMCSLPLWGKQGLSLSCPVGEGCPGCALVRACGGGAMRQLGWPAAPPQAPSPVWLLGATRVPSSEVCRGSPSSERDKPGQPASLTVSEVCFSGNS